MEKFLRILFIEDSEDDVFLISTNIQKAGYTVSSTRVDNDHDFIKALEQKDYWDVVLSDYALPGFSGRRALDIYRKTGLKMPFILVSGALGEDIAVLMLKSGASDFILKSNLRRLVPAIERGVAENKQRREQLSCEQTITPAEGIILRSPIVLYQGNLDLYEPLKYISRNLSVFGFSMEDFPDEKVILCDIIHPEDLEAVKTSISNYNKLQVDSYVLQYRIINKKQEIFVVKDYSTVIRNEQGEVSQREGSIIGNADLERSPAQQQENFEMFQSLFQDSSELLLVIAPKTLNIIDANRAACTFYGYTHDQILTKKIIDLSVKNQSDVVIEISKAMKVNNYRTYDKHKLANGQIRTLEIKAGQVNLGGTSYLRMVLFDITNQETREKIPDYISNYKDVLDILPHSTMITDIKHHILYANAECVKLFGYSSVQEMINKSAMELFTKEYAQVFADQKVVETIINNEQIPGMKVELISQNGTSFWSSIDCRLIKDTEGNPSGILSVFSDTSRQHRSIQDTELSEQRFRSNFEYSPIGIAMVTMDNSFIQVNQAFIRMMHWENRDYSKYIMTDLFHPEDIALYELNLKQLIDKSRDIVTWKCNMKISDSQNLYVQISANLISYDSTPQYFLIRMEDINIINPAVEICSPA